MKILDQQITFPYLFLQIYVVLTSEKVRSKYFFFQLLVLLRIIFSIIDHFDVEKK